MDETARTVRNGASASISVEAPLLAGRYRVRGVLGRGGMGVVYRVLDQTIDEEIALKIVHRALGDEVRLARRVTHPNVARTFDLGEHEELRFITMELVDGGSLSDVIDSSASIADRTELLGQIARGLAAIHDANITHRDLKPDNILVSAAGIAKISDFGIARVTSSDDPTGATGTPRYMAPEVLGGDKPTPASDMFAFGLIAFELLAGERYRGGDATAQLSRVVHDRALVALLVACLDEAPEPRPPASAVRDHFTGALTAASRAVAPPKRFTARVAAMAFSAATREAWLADSIPSELLQRLADGDDLEIASGLVASPRDARGRGIDVLVEGSLHVNDDVLQLAVRVTTSDELVLWARSSAIELATLPVALDEIATRIAAAVGGRLRLSRAIVRSAKVTELLLRASHESHHPWRDVIGKNTALLQEAHDLAPADPLVCAALAQALMHGMTHDSARYQRARAAAERAVELDPASADSQMAIAATAFLTNDVLGAIAALRAVLRVAPSLAEAHSMLGAIALDVGLVREALGRSQLALALDPDLAIARINIAFANELLGDANAADAALAEGLASEWPFARMLATLAGSRIALWRGEEQPWLAKLESVVTPIGRLMALALRGSLGIDEVGAQLPRFSVEWARQRGMVDKFLIELAIARRDEPAALSRLDAYAAAGHHDVGWFRSPLLDRIETAAIRDVIDDRARAIQNALRTTGLVAR